MQLNDLIADQALIQTFCDASELEKKFTFCKITLCKDLQVVPFVLKQLSISLPFYGRVCRHLLYINVDVVLRNKS